MRVAPSSDKFDRILTDGLNKFSMTLAALARIEDNTYELIAVKSDTGVYVPGEKFSLGNSFCRRIIETGLPLAEHRIEHSPSQLLHPLYESLPLECYIGAPVYHHGQIWGCIDFTSMVLRDTTFTSQHPEQVSELGNRVSEILDTD